jgi:hypothetical protein
MKIINPHKILVNIPAGKGKLSKPRHAWEDNIKDSLKTYDMGWI